MLTHPHLLWLLLILPLVGCLWTYARWRKRRSYRHLGNALHVERLTLSRPWRRRTAQACISLALGLIVIGMAGPHWGREKVQTRSAFVDLVVMLDVSRSMLQEQPSRLERAVRALEHLNETVRKRGEMRLGLVLGAAFPRLQLPPSQDYGHLDFLLTRVRENDLPPELWRGPTDPVSGTRLGAALKRAVDLHKPERSGLFDVLLVSDGNDPVQDEEWLQGVQAAREKGVPVHVLAIGDPTHDNPLAGVQANEGLKTRLNETLLKDIARRTAGTYIPAYSLTQIPLGTLMKEIQTGRHLREIGQPDGEPELTQSAPRLAWCYGAALAFFCLSLLLREGTAIRWQWRAPPARAWIVPFILLLLSAGPLPSVEDLIRQGNDAFAQGKFDVALNYYEKAETDTLDPGLIAFNKGAALHRLGDFRGAANHFERCLEDGAASKERRQKAHYDLGTTLLADAGAQNPDALRKAVGAFRSCLELAPIDVNLRDDARYNLELAQRLWLKAIAREPSKDKEPNGADTSSKKEKKEDKTGGDPKKDSLKGKNKDKTGVKADGIGKDKIDGKDKTKAPGGRLVLPDEAQLKEYTPEQMQLLLRDEVDRISRERQTDRRGASRTLEGAPNW